MTVRPLFITDPPEPGGLFSNGQIAELTGYPVMRLKEFQTKHLVHVRELKNSTGREPWNMSARGDAAAFVVLSRLRDMFHVDEDVLRAASIALYGWHTPEQEAKPWYPLLHGLYAAANEPRKMWLLRLRFLENDQTGQERITGFCYAEDEPPRIIDKPSSPWLPTGDLHLLLTPPLVRLVGAFRRFADANPALDA